jgi:exodeoxyribonuclease VII large subunit
VARAIHVCPIPVVSAVGHEIDFTISDFVADVRAPTPSAAAEAVVPDGSALLRTVATLRRRLRRVMGDRMRLLGEQLRRSARAYGLRRAGDIVLARQQRLDQVTLRLHRSLTALLQQAREQLEGVRKQLVALSPLRVLQRGYSVARLLPAMDVVKDVVQVREGDFLDVLFAKGAAVCRVKERRVQEK